MGVNLERGLQVEKDALAELRHAKEKEREAAAAKEIALADAIEVEKRQIEALEAQGKLASMEAEEAARLLKKKIDEDQARIIEAEAKAKSARDLFEGEKEALALQLSTEQGKLKG